MQNTTVLQLTLTAFDSRYKQRITKMINPELTTSSRSPNATALKNLSWPIVPYPTLLQQFVDGTLCYLNLTLGNCFPSLVWKNLSGLHGALTLVPSSTSGTNWKANCDPGIVDQHQCPTSLMLLWLYGSKYQHPCSNLVWGRAEGGLSQKIGCCYTFGLVVKTYTHNLCAFSAKQQSSDRQLDRGSKALQ